ncbi:hypothetical protein [Candidatus Mesenet endosymbiont of Agriotes lineatus]|uniref:hypothetical protein n=1 Tax=Candidatus Mesenet endosymbiont of Agriotes lineatus TaxID=3077948 RepID=UPI0030D2E26F
MTNSNSSASCVVNNYLGSSSTCTDRIARIFATIAAFSFFCSLSSAIASSGIYLLDHGLEAECSTVALSTFSIVTSVVGTVSFISAIGISYRLCSNYDVYSSSTPSISPPHPTPSIVVPSSHGINSSPFPPSYNIGSSISPQRSSTDSGFLSSHGVVPILSKSNPINCLELLELMETSF